MMSVVDDGLNLILLVIFDQIRWWTCEVGSMGSSLLVRQEKRSVKYVMDAP